MKKTILILVIVVALVYVFTHKNKHAGHIPQDDSAYHVHITTVPVTIVPGESMKLVLQVTKDDEVVENFGIMHEKLMHLLIVNDALTYYEHVHPEFEDGEFATDMVFPANDTYRLYVQFQPQGMDGEQTVTQTIKMGEGAVAAPAPDFATSKRVDDYRVDMRREGEIIIFTVATKDGTPVSNLEPYLGANGHLAIINQKTYAFLHVHPAPASTAGPEVTFLPAGLTSGTYRLFFQFQHSGKLHLVDFTLRIP